MSKDLRRLGVLAVLATLVVALVVVGQGMAQTELSDKEQLGKFLYEDTNLSDPDGQACASCHEPGFGFVDPDSDIPVSEGVIAGEFGTRNSPASAYAMYAPIFHFDGELWIGGQFWDGRAKGGDWPGQLYDPLAEQARGPFLNPVEMANTSKVTVLEDAIGGDYGWLFVQECGDVDLGDSDAVDAAYDCLAESIAAFERTGLFGQFSSKYDAYLAACIDMGETPGNCAIVSGKLAQRAGKKFFSKEEWYGMQLFMNENNDNNGILDKGEGAMCVACHVADWTAAGDYDPAVHVPAWAPDGMVPPVFTDFSFDNLGVPKSQHPLLVDNPVDLGLGTTVGDPILGDPAENGKFKVMTLRNVRLTAPYAHNGFFETLKEITHFYNTRDVPGSLKKGADWPAPEYPDTVNDGELGSLGLSDADEDAIVEFMKTLTDGWTP